MPLFVFKGVRVDGQVQEGELEAADEAAVVSALQKEGLIPIKVRPAGGVSGLLGQYRRRRISDQDVRLITRELATLLEAGMPLDRGLQTLIELTEDPPLHQLLTDIQERVRGGHSLSKALEDQRGTFSALYVNMVRAGEASGSLEAVLSRLADYLERAGDLKETVKSALIYPAILLVVASLSVILLLVFVVPQFTQMFADMGAALPLPTQIVIGLGDLFRGYWWAILAVITLTTATLLKQLERPEFRERWDRRVLSLPLFGDLIWKMETARFCNTLSTLLENGMPLLGALGLAKDVVANRKIHGQLEKIGEALKRGKGLAGPLSEEGVFPKLALQMIRVGEESGALDPMLGKVAVQYDRETRATVQRLLTLLEPILIIGMGVVVAGIIISILMAILGANKLLF